MSLGYEKKGTLADQILNKHLCALIKAFATHERVCQGERALPRAQPHIIVRGIERRSIFHDNQDCRHFLERLGNVLTGGELGP